MFPTVSWKTFHVPTRVSRIMENNVIYDTDIQLQLTIMATFLVLEWVFTPRVHKIQTRSNDDQGILPLSTKGTNSSFSAVRMSTELTSPTLLYST